MQDTGSGAGFPILPAEQFSTTHNGWTNHLASYLQGMDETFCFYLGWGDIVLGDPGVALGYRECPRRLRESSNSSGASEGGNHN